MAIKVTDPDTDPDMDPDPYCDTGKTCLGRGMHCPIASSYVCFYLRNRDLYCYELYACVQKTGSV